MRHSISVSPPPALVRRGFTSSKHGFSLVEVVMAIGIMAFAFVAIFSLLPSGMGLFRETMHGSVCSQIVQKVLADTQQTDFEKLAASSEQPELRYFDDQGDEIVPSDAAARQNSDSLTTDEKAKVLYHVNVRFLANALLPGSPAAIVAPHLASVSVQVAVNPANRKLSFTNDLLFASTPGVKVKTFSTYVAKND